MPTCPVCGFPKLKDPARSASGGGSYEICPSCGFQFGVDDDDKGISHEEARAKWISDGHPWRSKGQKQPAKWNPEKQLASLNQKPEKPKSVKKGSIRPE